MILISVNQDQVQGVFVGEELRFALGHGSIPDYTYQAKEIVRCVLNLGSNRVFPGWIYGIYHDDPEGAYYDRYFFCNSQNKSVLAGLVEIIPPDSEPRLQEWEF